MGLRVVPRTTALGRYAGCVGIALAMSSSGGDSGFCAAVRGSDEKWAGVDCPVPPGLSIL